MFSITSARYFLYLEPTDMRKSFDGLCGLVTSKLGQNPMSGDLYIFINKPRNCIKNASVGTRRVRTVYKRLEQGRLQLPKQSMDGVKNQMLDYSQLVMIINGISMENARKNKRFYRHDFVGN
ncbi:MAG: IS66 family insertion sequence element accessory protein TnpB [Bacteroidetes bacterium]|nr:IS66 family insertion sequence element accessory protein TnpB [Bacteroidota bacterium]